MKGREGAARVQPRRMEPVGSLLHRLCDGGESSTHSIEGLGGGVDSGTEGAPSTGSCSCCCCFPACPALLSRAPHFSNFYVVDVTASHLSLRRGACF